MIKILLVDDHQIILDGLSNMFSNIKHITICGTCLSGFDALKSSQHNEPDIIITDLKMPDMDGIDFIKKVKSQKVKSRILILSMCMSSNIIHEAQLAGANGYIMKQNANRDELLKAIDLLMDGKEYFVDYNDIVNGKTNLKDDSQELTVNNLNKDILSEDELKVLKVFAEGYTNKEISGKLMMKISLIEKHKLSIMTKLQLKSNVDLVKFAISNNICYM